MKQGLVKFFQKLLVYFWGKKHEHVSPHFYTTLARVLHDPIPLQLFFCIKYRWNKLLRVSFIEL